MAYSLEIGMRYLRGKKRSTISTITFIAITGVALGVAALLAVLSITSGFQREFRDKVLGVNAHVLILKYGIDFDEYRQVIDRARRMPEVVGAGPFLIHEMMLAKGDRLSGVLVKGVDPAGVVEVLDLPSQIVQGSLRGLRAEGAEPPVRPEDREQGSEGGAWDWLERLADEGRESDDATPVDAGVPNPDDVLAAEGIDPERLAAFIADGGGPIVTADGGIERSVLRDDARRPRRPHPEVAERGTPRQDVLSPGDVEAALQGDFALPDDAEEEALLDEASPEGTAEGATDTAHLPGAVVGATLARTLGIHVGDRVRLISPLTGLGLSFAQDRATPVSREYRVIAIFEAGFQEYDSRLVYVDLYEAQHFYGQGDSVTGVELRLRDLERSPEVAERLERELGGPFHTLDWRELNRNLFTALEIQKVMLSLVIGVIILVAAFNVIATLIMVVLEKKREIAILKAMGATDWDVLRIFMVQGVVVGGIGTLLGLVVGGGLVVWLDRYRYPLDPKIYLIDHLPVVLTPVEFVVTAVTAIVICSTATFAPSLWAARMLPVEGLRYE